MPILRDKKILFIHIPKTGGTSINKYLGIDIKNYKFNKDVLFGIEINKEGKGIEWDHATFEMIKEKCGEDSVDFQDYKIFTVIRNPYERIVSEFFHYCKMNKKRMIKNAETFYEFVKELEDKWNNDKSHYMKGRYAPQYKFIEGIEDKCNIIRFENLSNEFKSYMGGELEFLNKSEDKEDVEYYYNKELIYIVNKLYEKDFEIFGYKMRKTDFFRKELIYHFNREFKIENNDENFDNYDNYDIATDNTFIDDADVADVADVADSSNKNNKGVNIGVNDWKKWFVNEGYEILKIYNNMILYGNGNCLCNILFVKKNNRGYLYMEMDGKIMILGRKEIEFVNGNGVLDMMCSKCYNQKGRTDICLLIKYQVKKFFGGGTKNAIYLFNEKRWVDVDIFGSIILHNKYINIICSDGNLYKMKLVDFKRGCDNEHIKIELVKNLIIGGFDDDFKDCFVKSGEAVYEGELKNGTKIHFNFAKKKLVK